MKSKKQTIHNQGLSLVELIVAVAVLAIAMSGIIGMINLASRYYAKSSKEVELQDETQKTFTIVSNFIVGADKGIDDSEKASGYYVVKNSSEQYMIAKLSGGLYVAKYASGTSMADMKNAIGSSANLLAEHVTSFSIDKTHYTEGFVVMSLGIEYGSRRASLKKNVYLRNVTDEYTNIVTECEITCGDEETVGGKSQLTFKVKKTSDGEIASGSSITIVVRLVPKTKPIAAASLAISGDITDGTLVKFNQGTGVAVFTAKLSSKWSKNAEKTIKVAFTQGAGVDKNLSYITGIGPS